MIKVEHLYKNYSDEIKVLKDISFTFEDGKLMRLLVPAVVENLLLFAV